MMNSVMRTGNRVLMAAFFVSLVACTGGTGDLEEFMAEIKARPGGQRIEPLPQVPPYETFIYQAYDLRSPFMPQTPTVASTASGVAPPSQTRSKEFLEQYPLDTLEMVGTLNLGGNVYGLVQTSDGLVHRVVIGNYLGTNDGHITGISDKEIELVEIISDGLGSYIERPAAIALSD